jgi:hypothetical protein
VNNTIETILEELNTKYKTNSEDWTITLKESMLNKQHKVYYYFYSNIYSTTLKELRSSIKMLLYRNIHIDDSIYYVNHKDFIKADIPLQSDYSKKYYKHYKLINGNIKHSLLSLVENLKHYSIGCMVIYV